MIAIFYKNKKESGGNHEKAKEKNHNRSKHSSDTAIACHHNNCNIK